MSQSKRATEKHDAVADVLAVNYLMRRPLERDEVERVLHALGLANYEIRKREPHRSSKAINVTVHPGPTADDAFAAGLRRGYEEGRAAP